MGGDRKRFKLSPQSTSPPPSGTNALLCALRDSQTSEATRRQLVRTLRDALSTKLLPPLRETEASLPGIDKCFAAKWLDDKHVAIGTKCNKLLCMNVETYQMIQVLIPPAPARPVQLVASQEDHDGCGIHDISMSPDGSLLASGGATAADCQIYHVNHQPGQAPRFTPQQTLVGHQDWVFGSAWLTDRHIVTGSRDHSVKLWRVDGQGSVNLQPLETKTAHKAKVRDIKYCRDIYKLATLGVDGTVKLWDPSLTTCCSMTLRQKNELVCLAMDRNLIAVGSQSHVSMLDPRVAKSPLYELDTIDPGQGIRSVALMENILSAGSGRGRIAFYDLRASRYLSVRPEPISRPSSAQAQAQTRQEESDEEPWLDAEEEATTISDLAFYESSFRRAVSRASAPSTYQDPMQRGLHLQTGMGWLEQNHVYMDHFRGMNICNACYAHAWDPSQTKLFACGGPLAFGLVGSYAGLWD